MELNHTVNVHPIKLDPTNNLVQRFIRPSEADGLISIATEVLTGLVGTFFSPYNTSIAKTISSDAVYRADCVAFYNGNEGLTFKMREEAHEISALKNRIADTTDPLEQAKLSKELLLKKEDLAETKRDIVDRKLYVLSQMRGYFGEETLGEEDAKLVVDIEAQHEELLQEFKTLSKNLEAIRQEQAEQKVQRWALNAPFSLVHRDAAEVEKEFELAQHPWMRKGAVAFLQEHLNFDTLDATAVERALNGINGMFGKTLGSELNAGDLQQMIRAMEKAMEERGDKDAKLSSALTALKGLVATAVLENPDEIRRVLSLATFVFVGSMTGGVDGMLTASFAKIVTDRFLSQVLPQAKNKADTGFSQMLRVVEAGVVFASGDLVGMGAYAAGELAHHLIPEECKPMLVFGAAHFGLGFGAAAATGITLVADLPLTTANTVSKTAKLATLLCAPKKIPEALRQEIKNSIEKIKKAATEERWEELALRISAFVMPAIFLAAALTWAMLPLLALGATASIAISATMTITGFLSAAVIISVLKIGEAQKKAAMLKALNAWREDYNTTFPNPSERDQGVLNVFNAIETAIEEGRQLTKRDFIELLHKHIPSFQNKSVEELETALNVVARKIDPETAIQDALTVGE